MSLKLKISLFIGLIIFLTFGAASALVISQRAGEIERELMLRDRIIGEKITPTLIDEIGIYYFYQFDAYTRSVQKHLDEYPDLRYFRIINTDGQILFDTTEVKQGKYAGTDTRQVADKAVLGAIAGRKITQDSAVLNGEKVIRVIVPHIDKYGSYPAAVEYNFSTAQINKSVSQMTGYFILLTLLFQLVGISLAYWLVRQLTKPLLSLAVHARDIGRGELNFVAGVTSRDEIGELARSFNGMVLDIKESRLQIEEQNEQLRRDQTRLKASINGLNVGFIMTDNSNNVILLNNEAMHILAYNLTSSGVSKHGRLRADWTTAQINKAFTNFAFKDSLNQAAKTGAFIEKQEVEYNGRVLHVFVAPILDTNDEGKPENLGSVVLVEDVTEEKVLARSRDEFFSIASHELRTPLTAIRGNSSLILQYYADALKDDSLKEMVTDINESSVRLIGIVNDFLDVSRMEQGKLKLTPTSFALDEVIEKVIYEMAAVGKEKGVIVAFEHMRLDTFPLVIADQDRVKQIMYNLIGNALKFTDEGSVTLSIEQQDKFLKVFVTDTGPGISTDGQQLLFHKFQQAEQSILTRNNTRGTGLGLYISKLLVEAMGGVINLESSQVGKGSVFSVTLPIDKAKRK